MCFFSAPAIPPPPPMPLPPPPPSASDPEAGKRGDARRRRAALAKGRASTIMTGPLGVTTKARVGKRVLG